MPIFAISDEALSPVEPLPFLEKQIQSITEKNLQVVFGLQFICSEFSVGPFRIDTVAFDPQTSSFVLIEYKKGQSFSIIDQGYAYLSTMQQHKADFVLKYNQSIGASLGKEAFNWRGSWVIFVSPAFTEYQKEASAFGDLPLELCEVHLYSNNTIGYSVLQQHHATVTAQPVPQAATASASAAAVGEVPSEEALLRGKEEAVKRAYQAIADIIEEACPGADARVFKSMVGYYTDRRGLVWVEPSSKRIILRLRKGVYRDRYGAIKPDGWGGYPELRLSVEHIDLEYVRDLLEQAYSK